MTKEHKSGDSELVCQTLMTDCLAFISISGEASLPMLAAAPELDIGEIRLLLGASKNMDEQAMGFAQKSWAIDSSLNLKWFANLEDDIRYKLSRYGTDVCSFYTGCDLKRYCQQSKKDTDIKTFYCGVYEKAARQKDVTNVSDIVFNV